MRSGFCQSLLDQRWQWLSLQAQCFRHCLSPVLQSCASVSLAFSQFCTEQPAPPLGCSKNRICYNLALYLPVERRLSCLSACAETHEEWNNYHRQLKEGEGAERHDRALQASESHLPFLEALTFCKQKPLAWLMVSLQRLIPCVACLCSSACITTCRFEGRFAVHIPRWSPTCCSQEQAARTSVTRIAA